MLDNVRRRSVLIAALAGAALAALGVVAASSRASLAWWSHDRDGQIAFAHHTHPGGLETADIETIAPDGTDPRLLTSSAPGTASDDPAWGDGGNRIYFDSDRAGNVHLFAMKADGHNVRQLTRTDGWEFTPALSRDGKLLAFEHDNADFSAGGIYVSDSRGGRPRRLPPAHRRARARRRRIRRESGRLAERKADRLHAHPRPHPWLGAGGDLRHRRERPRTASADPIPARRRQAELVAGRLDDRLRHERRQLPDPAADRRRRERPHGARSRSSPTSSSRSRTSTRNGRRTGHRLSSTAGSACRTSISWP